MWRDPGDLESVYGLVPTTSEFTLPETVTDRYQLCGAAFNFFFFLNPSAKHESVNSRGKGDVRACLRLPKAVIQIRGI